MTAATKPKGLHAKLAEVMAEAGRIPKNGTAPASMGGFPFVQVGDAADAIRKALGDRGVSMLPSNVEIVGEAEHATSSGKTMTTLSVRTTWELVDGESGEKAQIQSLGTGADMGDKAAPKAQTNAMKYALLMGFLLSTGDDPEQTDSSDRTSRAPRSSGRAPAPAAASGSGGTEVEIPLGIEAHTGKITKGDGTHNQLEWKQTPTGWGIGFRLDLGDGKALPQVLIDGPIGTALKGLVDDIAHEEVFVEGNAVRVETPGRRPFRRLYVTRIVGTFGEFPQTTPTAAPEPSATEKVDDLDQLPF